jgi:hypothetical protein
MNTYIEYTGEIDKELDWEDCTREDKWWNSWRRLK